MRRAILAFVATVVIVVGLLQYKTSSAPKQFRVATAPSPPVASTPAPAAPTSPSPQAPDSPAPTPASSATTASNTAQSRAVSGPVVSTRYGDVQVQVIVAGGHITDVKGVQLPYDRARSAFISQQAAPLLHDEVLQAQSANIDTISGATYTSDAYAQSLQAALRQVGM